MRCLRVLVSRWSIGGEERIELDSGRGIGAEGVRLLGGRYREERNWEEAGLSCCQIDEAI